MGSGRLMNTFCSSWNLFRIQRDLDLNKQQHNVWHPDRRKILKLLFLVLYKLLVICFIIPNFIIYNKVMTSLTYVAYVSRRLIKYGGVGIWPW